MNTKVIFAVVLGPLLFTSALLAQTKDPVIGAYFNVEQALINQDLNGAKTAATDLAQKAQVANNGTISKDANDLAKTESLAQARQVFKALSEDALNHIQSGKGSQGMACSMGNAQVKPWLPKILGTGYPSTACSIGDTQCMRTQKSPESSCTGQSISGCGMMRNMCSGA